MMLIRGWPMSKLPDITLDDLPGLLAHINPDTDRDSWVKIGMGVKAHFGEDGFNDWNSWSQGREGDHRHGGAFGQRGRLEAD